MHGAGPDPDRVERRQIIRHAGKRPSVMRPSSVPQVPCLAVALPLSAGSCETRNECTKEPDTVGDLVRRYPLSTYFVIAYAGTWLAWAFFVLSRDGSGLLPFHSPSSFLILIGIGTFSGPTV